MRAAIVIPARYQSSRLPGKPLVEIAGTTLIRRVWERCIDAVPRDDVYIATDDDRIIDHCRGFNASVLMTSPDCVTGTDRVHEAAQQLDADCIVNVQGDEPMVDPGAIRSVITAWQSAGGGVINAMSPIADEAEFISPTVPKVVATPEGHLLYMSRAALPSSKAGPVLGAAMKQVCIYAFDRESLAAFAGARRKTPLEATEDIEILRFLELGLPVTMVEVAGGSLAVDVAEDVGRVEAALAAAGLT